MYQHKRFFLFSYGTLTVVRDLTVFSLNTAHISCLKYLNISIHLILANHHMTTSHRSQNSSKCRSFFIFYFCLLFFLLFFRKNLSRIFYSIVSVRRNGYTAETTKSPLRTSPHFHKIWCIFSDL